MKIIDEYVRFYFLFIHPHKQFIERNAKKFIFDSVTRMQWPVHLGLAFELFCHKNLDFILHPNSKKHELKKFLKP